MTSAEQEALMREALAEARKARPEDTAPNPRVGAVIAEEGAIVARGYHARDGQPHAERMALQQLGRRPQPGAVMAVTLEPCSTHGRTGACTDALIAAGIQTVLIGAIDPNPFHRGRAIELLRAQGIAVHAGILAEECAALNPEFNARMAG